jgi:hypothetical protein
MKLQRAPANLPEQAVKASAGGPTRRPSAFDGSLDAGSALGGVWFSAGTGGFTGGSAEGAGEGAGGGTTILDSTAVAGIAGGVGGSFDPERRDKCMAMKSDANKNSSVTNG